MLESVFSVAGATMALFGVFVLVDLAFSGLVKPAQMRIVNGAAFIVLALVSLGYNTEVRPGVIIDTRGAVIAAATVFGGTPMGACVSAAAALYRVFLGGAGAWAGVAGIAADFLLALGAVRLLAWRGVTWRTSLWPFVLAGAGAALGEASSLLVVPPSSQAFSLFRNTGPVLALVQLVTTVLIGGLGRLLWERHQEGLERAALGKRYELLSRYSNDAVILADRAGRIVEANEPACALYGYDGTEIRERSLDDLRAAATEEAGTYAGTPAALTGGFRRVHVRKDGTPVEVEVKGRALDEAGTPLQLLVSRQVKETEKTILRYHSALEASADGFVFFSRDGRVLGANQAFSTLTGYPYSELLGKSLDELTAEPAGKNAGIRDLTANGGRQVFESRWRRKDGTVADVEVSASAEPGSSESIIAFVRDVSERKRAERALAESEARYRLLAEHATDVIWLLDLATLRFTYVSPSVERLRGYTAEEVLAQPMEAALTPESSRRVAELLPRQLKSLAASEESYRTQVTELDQPRKDGSIVQTEVVTTILSDANGKPAQVIGVTRDITERKRNEQELRVKEAALASSSTGIVIAGLDGRITYLNAACLSMWGFDNEAEILGTSVAGYWQDPDAILRVVDTAVTEGRWAGELVARRKDGSNFEARILANRVQDADGKLIRLLGAIVDVTEQKQAATALQREMERLERASHFGRIILWEADLMTRKLETSGYADPLLPLQPGDPMTMDDFLGMIHPDDLPSVLAAMAGHLQGGEPLDQEFRIRRVDGTYSWVHDAGAALRDENGYPYRLTGAMSDVTALKEAEAALRANQARLEEAQALASLGSWSHDLVTGHLAWSPEVFRILEADSTAPVADAFHAASHPEEREHLVAVYQRAAEEGGTAEFNHRLQMADGRIKWVRQTYRVERAADGTPLRASGTIQDITDHILAREARQLAEAKEAAESANRAKSAFLASMSHEIRTPMNAILGFSQLLMGDAGLTARQHEQLEAIHRSGEHLLGLIDDVLEMSKIEAGRVTANLAETDLANLFWDLETMFQLRAERKGLYLKVKRGEGLPRHIVTDEKKLRQILINLMGNAVKFTVQGGLKVRIRTEPDSGEKCRLVVDVEDTGPGIAGEDIPRLFQRFEQTRTGREASSGTGLGLAISRGFARLMGGDITVKSLVGEGSVFTLVLPVTLVSPIVVPAKARTRRVVGLQEKETRRRVLVTDDVAANRDVLEQMLTRVGFEVRTTSSGAETLGLFHTWRPDLVLMDIKMPGIDGLEATRRIRSAETGGARVPIIAVTANAFEEDRRLVEEAGGDDFISKPFREAELFHAIGRCLGVSFVYEDERLNPEEDEAAAAAPAMTIPDPIRVALRSAIIAADLERVLRLSGELADPATAEIVRDLAERFEYDRLLTFLED